MIDPKIFDDFAKKFTDALPPGLKDASKHCEQTVKSLLQSMFSRLDLVTREEFDAQAAVLKRTREKIEHMERVVAEMEKKTNKTPPTK